MTDQDFFRLQNQWSKIYFRDISQGDLDRVLWINRLTGMRGVRILELGAGGGQFSVAACQLNHKVTAVEIEPDFVEHMRFLARHRNPENLRIINADFNTVELEGDFDLICYWDGFGLGSDSDQRRLLEKMSSWLTLDGSIFLEIFTPRFWASQATGVKIPIGDAMREYGFDAAKCAMTDTWWLKENPSIKTTQTLRCYSPADLVLLLEGSGLTILENFPGGFVDYSSGTYIPEVPLHQAMSYITRLVHTKSLNRIIKSK